MATKLKASKAIRKSQPDTSAVHVNRPLGNFSVQYMNSETAYIARKVFPFLGVQKKTDSYYKYKKGFQFRNGVKKRAVNAESAGIGYELTTDTYSCDVFAVHLDVPDQDRANQDDGLELDQTATRMVVDQHLLNEELEFKATYMTTSVWGQDVAGVAAGEVEGTSVRRWSDSSNADPVKDIDVYREKILLRTGKKPRHLAMGFRCWTSLKNCDSIIDRVKYGQAGVGRAAEVTLEILAALFEVDAIYVGEAVYDSGLEKTTDNPTMTYVLDDEALLFYKAPQVGLRVMTAGLTFGWTGYTGTMAQNAMRMRKMRMDLIEADRIEGTMAFDQKAVCTDCGVYFSSLVD